MEVTGLRVGPKRKSGPGRQSRYQRELKGKPGRLHQSERETWQVNDVDRVAGTIRERVTDRHTGEDLMDKTEPLQEHQSRGSAKPRE